MPRTPMSDTPLSPVNEYYKVLNKRIMEEKTAEEIAKEILYLPVTNGQAESSIKKGAELIELYAGQSRWISVETPPGEDCEYNVCYKMPNNNWHVFTTRWSPSFKRFDFGNSNITHYQPLPTTPTP